MFFLKKYLSTIMLLLMMSILLNGGPLNWEEDSSIWIKNGVGTVEEADQWNNLSIRPEYVLELKRANVKPSDMNAWKKVLNYIRATEVSDWKKAGIKTPEEAKKWLNVDVSRYSVEKLLSLNVSPSEVSNWTAFGMKSRNIRNWIKYGIKDFKEAKKWYITGVNSPSLAYDLKKNGVSPKDLPNWMIAGVKEYTQINDWIKAGVKKSSDVVQWQNIGVDHASLYMLGNLIKGGVSSSEVENWLKKSGYKEFFWVPRSGKLARYISTYQKLPPLK